STLIISEQFASNEFIDKIQRLSDELNTNGPSTLIFKPNNIIDENQLYNVNHQGLKSQYEIIEECFTERGILGNRRESIMTTLITIPKIKEGTTNKEEILQVIEHLESIFKE
ncbi:TPA: DNA helicase UvrD, partial [Streptococcus suis]